MPTLRRLWLRSPRPSDYSVLVVDDESDIRDVVKAQLEEFGFIQIREADSGERALNLVHLHAPDLIILDYMMPEMNGERVAYYLRLMAPDSLILAFSGVIDYHPDWADGFVPKLWIDKIPKIAFDLLRKVEEGVDPAAHEEASNAH
jgi:hypothetical protein